MAIAYINQVAKNGKGFYKPSSKWNENKYDTNQVPREMPTFGINLVTKERANFYIK